MITENNYTIQAFQYSENGKKYFIPEPDPVLIYFHCAQNNLKRLVDSKKELLEMLNPQNESLSEGLQSQIFEFYGLSNGFIIFLFTTIEAFLNKLIPENYEYKKIQKNKTEIYNHQQIQQYLSFDEKRTKILIKITGKDFSKKYPKKNEHILNLKAFRDSIVHTKTTNGINKYGEISKAALNFKYQETILAVRDFLNFYINEYIEDCPCQQDFQTTTSG